MAATIALPVLWFAGIAVLAGLVPELRTRAARSRSAAQAAIVPSSPSAGAGPSRDPGTPVQAGTA